MKYLLRLSLLSAALLGIQSASAQVRLTASQFGSGGVGSGSGIHVASLVGHPYIDGPEVVSSGFWSLFNSVVVSTETEDIDYADEHDPTLPSRYELRQNYPNPFNPSTTIVFDIPESSTVRLEVFDMLGRSVALLVDGDRAPGSYRVRWDGRMTGGAGVSTGLYIYRLETPAFSESRTMTFIK